MKRCSPTSSCRTCAGCNSCSLGWYAFSPALYEIASLTFSHSQTDEDVLVTFDLPVSELESKLTSISTALKHVIADTGFCVSVEPVVLGEDGRVVRGSWTPVATSSAPMSAKPSAGGGGVWKMPPLKTAANPFATLGGGGASPPKNQQPLANAWGTVYGNGQAKVSATACLNS